MMENFFNQMREQTSGAEESKAGLGGTKDQKIPLQKTRSFKGEKKSGGQNWFQKQFARRSGDHDSRDMDHAAAVAAAAFAINLQDASEQKSETPKAKLTKNKSKVDCTKPQIPLLSSASKRLSGSFRYKDDQGKKVPKTLVTDEKRPEEAITTSPSMKKTSTFTDEKPEISTEPDPVRQPTVTESRTKANEWEKAKLEEIRQRYHDFRELIDAWQNKKKMKARRKLNKEERGIELKRMKALENFQNKITAIDKMAERARTKAEESRKNEELKAKEKANVIRTTGKLPGICFCF